MPFRSLLFLLEAMLFCMALSKHYCDYIQFCDNCGPPLHTFFNCILQIKYEWTDSTSCGAAASPDDNPCHLHTVFVHLTALY